MKQKLLNKLWLRVGMIVAIMTTALSGTVWADTTTTYTFSSGSWEATPASWNAGQNGGFTTGQGVQVTANNTGANATSPKSFTNVNKIVVTYCTNSKNGVGTIKVQVGSGTEKSFSVTKPSSGGTTLKTTEFTFSPNETGNVKITVDCTTNSIYIYSIAITEASSGPVQLDAPELTATPSNNTVTLEWNAISNASGYTIQYADNAEFTGATTINNATSPKEISGLTNGTTYYFKAMTVGDETSYLSSDYGDAVSATPANVSKITITQNELTSFTNSYDWYEWTAGGVSGQAYAYKNNGMQFNSSKDGYWIYNTSAIPGTITSVKMVKASGTDRSWTLRAGTSAIPTTDGGTQIGSAQTVGTSGATWNVEGSYKYFCLIVSGGSTVISSIEITYIPSTDPVISASDVDITYDATSGSIDYTLENATGNVSATVTTGDWLTLGTITEDEVPFTCAANTGAERTATVTLSFSGADDKVVTVTQAASPARYTTISDLFAGAPSTATDVLVTFGNWVVSGVSTNGKNVFVTDNAGNGFVIYDSAGGLASIYAVGNILSGTAVPCSLKLNSGYAQLTSLDASDVSISTGGTVNEANITMSSLAGVNTGALVSYENLTCSVDDSGSTTKYYLSDGTTTLQVYNSLYAFGSTLENGHKYNITGIYQQYGETKELLPRSSADIVEVFTPAIAATPTSLTSFTYEVDNGPSTTKTISVTGENLSADITLSLGNNSDFEMCLTENGTYTNSLTLTQSAGAVAATTVYVRLKAGLAIGNSYSGTITLTSTDADNASVSLSGSVTEPVVDYATLPFSYDGNGSGTLPYGLITSGTGTYGSSPKIKLDSTGDYVVLKINDAPGILAFDVKANPSSNTWTGTLTVQTAGSDGSYSDFTSYNDLFSNGSEVITKTITNLPANVRYIKWIYTKTTGNVALGRIVVEKPSVTLNASGYATYTSNSAIDYSDDSEFSAWAITSIDGTSINFSQITGAVPAGTGVLLKGTAGQVVSPVATSSGTELTTNLLEGITIATTVAADTYYGLSGNEFVKVNAGTVPAGKALLPASALNSNVKAFTFVFEDDATGINEELRMKNEESSIYNLAGQRLDNSQFTIHNSQLKRGIYIVNGKKVLK